jgi:serine/threonine protein kinase
MQPIDGRAIPPSLEHVECGSLAPTLDGTPWLPRRAAGLAEALGRAVAEAHRLRIVHCDLNPGNVLLAAAGTPRIADFGLATIQQRDMQNILPLIKCP